MKNNTLSLPVLWSAAALTLLLGLLLSVRAVSDLGRTTELWRKKGNDLQELTAMRGLAAKHRSLLSRYAQYPSAPAPLGELAGRAVPGLNVMMRSAETYPSAPGWTTRKATIGLADIPGDDLGRFFEALTTATPPWAILECTLTASPAQGRLAKVELVLATVERN